MLHIRFAGSTHTRIVILQLFQYNIGTIYDATRHTGYFSHMNTKRVLTSTRFQLTQEDNLAIHLLHAYIEILDARKVLFHLIQFVIVGSKERTCLRLLVLMQVFHDSPSY